MSLSRFYLSPSDWQPVRLTLSGAEALHCARVLRHQVGDEIEVGDGVGRFARGRITGIRRDEVNVEVVEVRNLPPAPFAIHLLPSLIKAEAFEWLLEKAVELGAASITPVITARSVVHATEQVEKKMAKWRRLLIESAKQCHTPFLPEMHMPRPFLLALAEQENRVLKLIPLLSPRAASLKAALAPVAALGARPEIALVIGPEGDFTGEEEATALAAGFLPVTLGPLVLRAETAAIASLAVLSYEMRESFPASAPHTV